MQGRRYREGRLVHRAALRLSIDPGSLEEGVPALAKILGRAGLADPLRAASRVVAQLDPVLARVRTAPNFCRKSERAGLLRYARGRVARGERQRDTLVSLIEWSKQRRGLEPDYAVQELVLWLRYLLIREGLVVKTGVRPARGSAVVRAFDAVLSGLFDSPPDWREKLHDVCDEPVFPIFVRKIGVLRSDP